jgi:serine/threonine-protein kinase
MGIVYKAQDPAIGRTIAIKSIRLSDLSDESERGRLRERLFREAQSAGILSHPGIVTIYDIAEENGMAFIFMEYVNGPPLEKMLLTDQTPDKETLLSIFRQTAAALDYAHKKGIVHRDIKPANIMIHEDGTAKITDFGVAKILSQQMTQAGTMMGTPSYMSPEQVQGGTVDGRADQFSLAVIVYEVLTGEKPFSAEYLPTLLYKIVREDPLPPQRLNTTLPPQVEVAMRKAMSKNPAERYATCTEYINALAVACNMNSHWMPIPRGTAQNMPTVASSAESIAPGFDADASEPPVLETPIVIPVPEPPPAPVPVSVAHTATVETSPIPAEARRVAMAGPAAVGSPLPYREEAHTSNTGKRVATLIGVLVVLGIAGLIGRKMFFEPAEEGTGENPPARSASVPAPKTAPPVEKKTPPPKPAPEKPVESAAVTPAAETAPAPPRPETSPAPRPPKGPAESVFQVVTIPAGASVVFDGESSKTCKAPCTLPMGPARHTILASLQGYRDARRIIEVPRDSEILIELVKATGTLSLNSNPPGSTIKIDGKEIPQKTPATIPLPVGSHHVEVIRGSEVQGFNVDIQDGVMTSRTVNWNQ